MKHNIVVTFEVDDTEYDAELAERLLDAKVEFDDVLDEVLDEAERSETEDE